MKKILIALLLLITPCFAAQDYYQFETIEKQHRFETLTSQFRCLVCQNQNISESNAPLAADLRGQIYQQIQHGKSDNDIIQYLLDRYGDYVLYRPPFNAMTIGLWLGPFILLVGGLIYLIQYIRKAKSIKG